MNRCTYVLAGTTPTTPNITYPATLSSQLKDIFAEQEKERHKLRTQVRMFEFVFKSLMLEIFLAFNRKRKISFICGTRNIASAWPSWKSIGKSITSIFCLYHIKR